MSTPTGGNALSTDFDLMRSVAAAIDTRNEEIRATLQAFIGRMSGGTGIGMGRNGGGAIQGCGAAVERRVDEAASCAAEHSGNHSP